MRSSLFLSLLVVLKFSFAFASSQREISTMQFLYRPLFYLQDAVTRTIYGAEAVTAKMNFYDLVDKDMNGKELVDNFGDKGFKVLAFPCNQFGGQEPGSNEEIIEFVKKFDPAMPEKLTFFEKKDVNGADAREVFSFLKRELPSDDGTSDVRWNFAKFLVDAEGKPFKRYAPTTAPDDILADIEALLKK